MLNRAVEDWQIGPKEAFLPCIRKRNDDAHHFVQLDISDLTQRLHQQGATTVVVNYAQPCAGPTRANAQLEYDSVEILGVTVF